MKISINGKDMQEYSNGLLVESLTNMKYGEVIYVIKDNSIIEIEVNDNYDSDYDSDERYEMYEFNSTELENRNFLDAKEYRPLGCIVRGYEDVVAEEMNVLSIYSR